MSDSSILTLRLAKEGFHQFRQFLDSAQSAERQSLHFVLGLHKLPGNLAFDMCPHLFVRVELGRVRRQVEQLEHAALCRDKFLDQLCLVNRMTIDNQEDRAIIYIGGQTTVLFVVHHKLWGQTPIATGMPYWFRCYAVSRS